MTPSDRLRSSYHRIWYEATQASRWSRGTYREAPSMTALNLSPLPCVRTEKLAAMYGTRFELRYPPKLTVLNYGYPDLLDRTRRAMNWGIFHHHQVCDVDSADFAYAGALQAFFHPSYLVGTEVDGHPLFAMSKAATTTHMAIFRPCPIQTIQSRISATNPADIIPAWDPFVTPQSSQAWNLL